MGEREEPKMASSMAVLRGAVIKEEEGWGTETNGLSAVCGRLYKSGTLYLQLFPCSLQLAPTSSSHSTSAIVFSSFISWCLNLGVCNYLILGSFKSLHAGVCGLTDYVHFLQKKVKMNQMIETGGSPPVTGCQDRTF